MAHSSQLAALLAAAAAAGSLASALWPSLWCSTVSALLGSTSHHAKLHSTQCGAHASHGKCSDDHASVLHCWSWLHANDIGYVLLGIHGVR
jgi:hypothetical protein